MNYYDVFYNIVSDTHLCKKLLSIGTLTISLKEFQKIVKLPKAKDVEEFSEEVGANLITNPLVINSGIKKDGEAIMVSVSFLRFKRSFVLRALESFNKIIDDYNLLNNSVEEELRQKIRRLTQPQSEILVENILTDPKLQWIKDFKLNPTRNDDGGRDFMASLLMKEGNEEIGYKGYGKMQSIVGQLKHYKNEVKPEKIREFTGTMEAFKKKIGIFVSTNGYTEKAILQAKKSELKVFCWDASDLARIMTRHGIGIKKIQVESARIPDEVWWNEIQLTA